MEKLHADADSRETSSSMVGLSSTVQRVKERKAQLEQEREEAAHERREGRLAGKLTASLAEKLRSCNVAQLERVKQLCDRYAEDHRKPPPSSLCRHRFTVKVLDSVTVKNRRYQLEFRRTTKSGKKVYVGGPYVRAYYRDGSIIKIDYFKKKDKNLRVKLPRKVWSTFKDRLTGAELESVRLALMERQNA